MGIIVPREKYLNFLIHDVARLLRRSFDQKAQGSGLTRAQWQVLAHLHYHEGCNQQAVASALEIEPITLSRHIDRLEALGYVERQPDPTDRRARRLRLTKDVQPLLEDLRCVGTDVLDVAMAGIDAEHSEAMVKILSTMRANMSGRAVTEAEAAQAPARIEEPVR